MSAKELIATTTVGAGGAATVTFSSIPQTYTDLQIVYSLRSTKAANVDNIQLNINAQGISTNVSTLYFLGDGASTATSAADFVAAGGAINGANTTANTFTNGQISIPNYAGTAVKHMVVDCGLENNATYGLCLLMSTLWNQTAAINSITLDPESGNFVEYSTASLYGWTKGSGGATVA